MFDTGINGWKTTRTFATRENLEKALIKEGLHEVGGKLMVWGPDGRVTCVFAKSFLDAAHINVMTPCHLGFKVMG